MLSPEELEILEATLLPALERHHLRLLAHGLRTLQSISGGQTSPMPSRQTVHAWAMRQPASAGDAPFADAFMKVFRATPQQALGAWAAKEAKAAPRR